MQGQDRQPIDAASRELPWGQFQLGSNVHFNAMKSRHVVSIEENCSLTEKRSPNIHQEKFEKPFQNNVKTEKGKQSMFSTAANLYGELVLDLRNLLYWVFGDRWRLACGNWTDSLWWLSAAWTGLSLFLFWTIGLCFSLIDLSQLISL